MIEIINNGALLTRTNYWDTAHAARGLLFASWNAGALRLLVIDEDMIDEMRTGKTCLLAYTDIAADIPALRVVFDDDSDAPYQVTIDNRQSDRIIPKCDQTTCRVLAYTRNGLQSEWPGVWE